MKHTDKQLISKLHRHSKRIEQDKRDAERDHAGESAVDTLNDFRRQLQMGLQQVADECLNSEQTAQDSDQQTQHELLRAQLGRVLARSPEARLDYIARHKEFQSRFEK